MILYLFVAKVKLSLQKNKRYPTLYNNDRFVQISMLVQEMGKFLNCSFVLLKIDNYLKL